MNSSFAYLPPDKRKKIFLICDDIRVHSGVATVAREIVIHTAQHFNWVNVAGAITHPEKGKRLDLSQSTNETSGLTDSSVTMYPVDGYGDPDLLRQLIKLEKPDAIMLITDPRYFTWLFAIENEIRKSIPIASAGNPEQKINEARAADPLGDTDPSDPGVDIGGLLRMTGGWKKIK